MMERDALLEKLAVLIPERVEAWRRSLAFTDAPTRALIEQEIRATAHRLLGDTNKRLFLSPPSEAEARGVLRLGSVVFESEKWQVGLRHSDVMQHVAIFGRSGAGKTNAVFGLLQQLSDKRIPFVFLDWKRTGRHLMPHLRGRTELFTPGRSLSPFTFNPFLVPPGVEANTYLLQVSDVLTRAYQLGVGSRSLIERSLRQCYTASRAPALFDVMAALRGLPEPERVRAWKISGLRALESLELAGLTTKDAVAQEAVVQTMLAGQTIVELNGLSSQSKAFLVPLIALWIYSAKLASNARERLELVLVLEEAHHVLRADARGGETVMTMLLRQCRELGIGIVIVDQHPHLMHPVVANAATTILLNLRDPRDVKRGSELVGLSERDRRFVNQLPVGDGVVRLERVDRPFLVRFPLVSVEKGSVTDAEVSRLLRGNTSGSVRKTPEEPECGRFPRILASDDALSADELAFVCDVLTHSEDGVRARYARLGWSADRGNRVKRRLVEGGVLEAASVPVGRSRKVVLRVSGAAGRRLGLEDWSHGGRESLAHAYWKARWAKEYRRRGYEVRVEVERERSEGRMDVLAVRGAERVALEVETGRSDVVANVRRDLREGVSRVVVVATDAEARQKVERALVGEGLVIPGRVEVVVGGRRP